MYILSKPLAWIGILITALSPIFFPFLKVPLLGNWNLYETDTSLFVLTYGFLGLCILFLFLRKVSLYRIFTRIYVGWCLLAFGAVYFKINHYFGMKLADNLLSKTLHLKWGWLVLFLGALLLFLSVRKPKPLQPGQDF